MSFVVAIGPSSFAQQDKTPHEMLVEAGVTVKPNPYGRRLKEDEIIDHLEGVDGLIAGLEPLNGKVLQAAKQLKAVARVGIGVANVDHEAAAELGIQVSSTPEGPVAAVAEMTVAALLTICRRLLSANKALHEGKWEKSIGTGLAGTRVLLVGYGRIGRRTGELLRAFGAKLLVHDPYIDPETLADGEHPVSLKEGLADAEVVSLHASGADAVLTALEFAQMRDGVILLNSARGELVAEEDLVAALESGKVSAAWFDAFVEEPYNGPLTKFDNVLLTPHMGTYTQQCRLSMETEAVKNLLRDLGVSSEWLGKTN